MQDPILHWAIRAAMNSIKGDIKLTEEVLADKSLNYISYSQGAHSEDFEGEAWEGKPYWIESLEGLQYATSVTSIDIAYTASYGPGIKDLSPLSGLTQLEKLKLRENGITDISPISELVNLKELDLALNREIEDISALSGMTKLESMDISFNKINTLASISEMENLRFLQASNNLIEELPDCSKLAKVYFLDLSRNNLTDISALAGMKGLQELDLSGNDGITDIRPLAGLIRLEKDRTTLPEQLKNKKDDLFAAIDVNKLFNLFNISKMKESDLDNVENALMAYEALTDEQKTYFDDARIEAARSNMEKVQGGQEPDYYPEYDIEGERQPVFSSVEFKVLDKYGNPMPNVEFVKKAKSSGQNIITVTTDKVGSFIFKHTPMDALHRELVVVPESDEYVAIPESIEYTVEWGNETGYVNGEPATGLEDLVFTLIPKDEYVDKAELEELLSQVKDVEEAYKYTQDSYQSFENALAEAKAAFDNVEAKEAEVASAVSNLQKAYDELEKTDILTELKIIVKDKNGNPFSRSFKFRIQVPGTGAEAWNDGTDAETSTIYLKAAPGWEDGKRWEVIARPDEPYTITPFEVTIGVKDGQRYFKTVDGKNVGVDFEKEVVVIPMEGEITDSYAKPDSTLLEKRIEEAKEIDTNKYTPASVETFETVLSDAEKAVSKSGAVQEDFNAAIVALESAIDNLVKSANKYELDKEISKSYSKDAYTKNSWDAYAAKLVEAQLVSKNGNASQKEVDNAVAALKEAANNLVRKADKTGLEAKVAEAKTYKAEDYQSGYDELQAAIETAQAVLAKEEPTEAEINTQIEALDNAIKALVEKPKEENWSCDPTIFRAKVMDADGTPVAGVNFEVVINGAAAEEVVSNNNGIITYYTGMENNGKTTYIRLADERYTTKDEHFFEANGSQWAVSFTSIDGNPYTYDTVTKLTYTLTEKNGGSAEPENKHSMKKTEAKDATCTEDGNIEYYTCTECEKIFRDESGKEEIFAKDTVIESAGHSYKWKVTKTATSSRSGSKTGTCEVCKASTGKKTISQIKSQQLSYTKVVANGEQQIPEVIIKNKAGNVLVEDVDYTLTKPEDAVNAKRYKISVKYKGDYSGTKTLYYTIVPKAPESARAQLSTASSTGSYDDVKFTWTKSEGASGYLVYYKKEGAAKWSSSISTTNTSYTKKNLSDGINYIFKVVPYYKTSSSSTKYYDSEQYVTASAYTLQALTTPKMSVEGASDGKFIISWTNIMDADGVEIKNCKTRTGTFKDVLVTADNEQNQAEVSFDTGRPFYKIRAYKVIDGNKIYAPYSAVVTNPAAPEEVKAELYGYDDVKVSWSKVPGASGYYVYYKKASKSSYTSLGTTTSLYKKKSGLAAGTEYDFKVVPYYKSGSSKYKSTAFAEARVYTLKALAKPKVTKEGAEDGKFFISWTNIKGADGVEIRAAKTSKGTYKIVFETEDAIQNQAELAFDVNYTYYKIRAYKVIEGKKIYAPYSSYVKKPAD